jgi:sugar lactone lactonase YvrE
MEKLLTSAAVVAVALVFIGPALAQTGDRQGGQQGGQQRAAAARQNQLVPVATFQQQVTGVTVSEDGRIFVNFPRWTEDVAVSVAEVMKDGSIRPYPNADWNAWRNARMNEVSPKDHFVCVQSVVADGRGSVWVLDPAAPNTERVVKDAPKLVQIDLGSNQVKRVIAFDESVAPQSSYLNDVRFSPDGKWAYITDSGKGAIVVVDLATGQSRRLLDGHPSTQFEKDVTIVVDGRELRRPDGRQPMFNSDGIALDARGEYLYWQALTGKTLYRIPTAALVDVNAKADQIALRIENVTTTEPVDGLWIDGQDRIYLSSLQDNAVKVLAEGRITTLVQDSRLRWPDTFAQGPDGAIYVTASHIQDSPWFHKDWVRKDFSLFRIPVQQEATGSTAPAQSRR